MNSCIYTKIMVALFLAGWISCDIDFLNKPNPTQLSEEDFYNNESQFKQAVNGVYGQLQSYISEQWMYSEFISDNTTLHFNQSDRGQGGNLEQLEFWKYNSASSNVRNLYNRTYNCLMNINNTLDKLAGADFDQKIIADFEGQLRFLRAFYYFDLVRLFGDVIIVTKPISSVAEAYEFSRAPVGEVYDLIESDLSFAISSLPEPSQISNAEKGRISRGAALTLLGKVYLTRNQYTSAVSTLQEVPRLGYQLVSDYSQIFNPDNKNNSESIFEVQFQEDSDVGEWSGFIYNFYPRESYGAVIKYPGISGGGWNIPTRDMIAFYENGDLRKDISLAEGYVDNDGNWLSIPFITKFYHEESYTVQGRPGNNWISLRYADVMLMLAEAINEVSGPGDAYSWINPIRSRAGLEPLVGLNKDSFREAVLRERRAELAFENHRWFDLKRTMSDSELVSFLVAHGERERANPTTSRGPVPFAQGDYRIEAYQLLFPIPSDEFRINPNLVQNPGY